MSYKSKKLRRNKFGRLKYKLKKFKIVLLKNVKNLTRRNKSMQLQGVRNVMEFLRTKNKIIKQSNLKINEWVDNYLNNCFLKGEVVNILTQWCVSKDLEERFKKQGERFIPTRKERRLFEKDLPEIVSVFKENGFRLNWWITFNRSYLDSGRIDKNLEGRYIKMITDMAEEYSLVESVAFIGWEENILSGRPGANRSVLDDFERFVPKEAYTLEFKRHSDWAEKEAGLKQTNKELEKDVKFQVACEIEEGRFLMSEDSPFAFGNFILIPLETAERYVFFQVIAKDFKKRIVSVVSEYPWRL